MSVEEHLPDILSLLSNFILSKEQSVEAKWILYDSKSGRARRGAPGRLSGALGVTQLPSEGESLATGATTVPRTQVGTLLPDKQLHGQPCRTSSA